ncbi:MAG: baseplate protein [Candidatus Nanopelagicales bacterium]|nr:baseplate hub [Synechococcus phage DSL-LC03]
MPLPQQTAPHYDLTIPSNGKKIKFRPFFVREEKILIMAVESQDIKQISNAIKQVLSECIITKGIKVENLPVFDIEYLFLNIRAKSVGESIDLIITCGDDGETTVPVTIFVDEIKVDTPENHSQIIDLDNGYFIKMKYPSLIQFIEENFELSKVKKSSVEIGRAFKLVASCMDSVYNDEEAWSASDCTEAELIEYIEKLTPAQYKKVEEFFSTMPKLSHTLVVNNPKTGVDNNVTLEGLSDFFG